MISIRLTMSAPWMLERYAGAREHFKVRKPKSPEGSSDVTVRESPEELTLRAEEVNTSKALINVNHVEPERWSPPLVDADWYAFCQELYKGIEGEDWKEMCESYKEMRNAVGVRKPEDAQKFVVELRKSFHADAVVPGGTTSFHGT